MIKWKCVLQYKVKCATAQAILQKHIINVPDLKKNKQTLGYPELLKLLIFLDLVTICITHARQIKSGKVIMVILNVSTVPC